MTDAWVENTSTFDRVKSVVLTLSEPKTAACIAEESHVSESTACSHLTRLADLGVLVKASIPHGPV